MIKVLWLAGAYMAVQAAALLLTQSGDWGLGWKPAVRAAGLSVTLLPVVALAAVAAIAGVGRTTTRRRYLDLAGWRTLAAVVVLTLAGTLVRPSLREYAVGLLLTATFVSIGLSLLIRIALTTDARSAAGLTRWLRVWRPALPWLASAWTLLVSAALSWLVFERIPHVPDEVAYWFQAKYFAAGKLFLPAPPDVAAFELPHTLVDAGKWYGIFPPGWPAVLAAGVWLGVPWLVNPALGALAVLLLHALARRLYSQGIADLAAVLLAASPMFLLMSGGLMSHPLSLVLGLVALLGWVRGVEGSSRTWQLGGGLALGGLVLTRPFEGVIFTVVLSGWAIGDLVRRGNLVRVAGFLAVAIATGSTMLLYNRALTGRPTYDPITKYFDQRYYPGSNRLGFGSDVGNTGWANDLQPGHSPAEAVINGHRNGYLLNLELFGWTCGSLVGVAALLLWGRLGRPDAFIGSIGVGVVAGLGLYWYSGADFGARYWYQLMAPLAMLTARGLQSIAARPWPFTDRDVVTGRLGAALGVAALTALLMFLPWRAATKYYHYRGMGDAVSGIARAESFGHALVFVRGAGPGTPFSRYSAAAVYNPAVLDRSGPLFTRDLGPDSRRRIECAFAGRVVRRIDTAALPAGPVRIDEGPAARACPAPAAAQVEAR